MKLISAIIVLFVVAALGYLSYSSYSTNSKIEDLIQKNGELEKLVERNGKATHRRLLSIEKGLIQKQSGNLKTPAPKKQNTALESKANEALNEIRNLVSKNNIPKARKDLADFLNKYNGTRVASRARRLSQELSVVGMDVPKKWGIEKWIQGKSDIDLNSNDTILLVFWEEWCGFCRREVPKIQKMYAEYKGKGLKVAGLTKINRSASQEKVNAFIKENNLQFPVAKEDGSMSKYFKVQGVPAAALMNNGKIVWRGHPSRLPMDMVKKHLNIKG